MDVEINVEGFAEMPPDGSTCYACKEVITGKMFQYFMFAPFSFHPEATKYKYCEVCYNKEDEVSVNE